MLKFDEKINEVKKKLAELATPERVEAFAALAKDIDDVSVAYHATADELTATKDSYLSYVKKYAFAAPDADIATPEADTPTIDEALADALSKF